MSSSTIAPRWRPVSAIDRRVLGVLVEKAKTTPDAYPMSVNALCTGANQKNNRYPLMQLEPDDVEASLERLRAVGAVAEVQGGGRVLRYRHYMYDWLGVDKVEMAVMTELLLRGAQSVGELRGRAARMEPIADLAALRPVLESLKAKGLLLELTAEGRGQIVSHALYEPAELEKVRRQVSGSPGAGDTGEQNEMNRQPTAPQPARPMAAQARPETGVSSVAGRQASAAGDESSRELTDLRAEVAALRREVEELAAALRTQADEFERFRASLGG